MHTKSDGLASNVIVVDSRKIGVTAEIFKLVMPGSIFFVFVTTQNAKRRSAFERAPPSIGATVAGPQAFSLVRNSSSREGHRELCVSKA
jgi:hypothetical protein